MHLDYKCRGLHCSPAGENKWYLHCSLDKQSGTISKIDRRKVVEHSSRSENSFWKMRGVSFLTPPFPLTVFKAREYLTIWARAAALWKLWTHTLTAAALLFLRLSDLLLVFFCMRVVVRMHVCSFASPGHSEGIMLDLPMAAGGISQLFLYVGGVSARGLQQEEEEGEEEESRLLSWMTDQRLHMWWCSGPKKQQNSRSSFCLLSQVETICPLVWLCYLCLFHYFVLVGQTCEVIKSPALRCLAKISKKWFYLDGFILLDRE